jgi:hypothetical protein
VTGKFFLFMASSFAFDPELVDSFVEKKNNSDIKVICSDLHIFLSQCECAR